MSHPSLSISAEGERKRPRSRLPKVVTSEGFDTVVLLAGLDTICFSSRARVSEQVYAKLREAKAAARLAEKEGAAHCPVWLSAQVRPTGARGGYPYLLDADDFAVKVAGEHQVN